jgi:hypothetical protein
MATPEDADQYERCDTSGVVLYVERALTGEAELEFVMPSVGTFVIRRADDRK